MSLRSLVPASAFAAVLTMSYSSVALEKFSLQMGATAPSVSYLRFYVAEAVGFNKVENLDVKIQYSQGAPQATQLVLAGQADIGVVSFEPVVQGFEKRILGKAVAGISKELVYYIAVPENSTITSASDLKGKKIGVVNLGSASIPIARSILRRAGIQPGPDTFVPVGAFDQAAAALNSGAVEALALFEGMYLSMERAGSKFRYIKHPTLEKFGNGILLASPQGIASKREQICGFGRALGKATAFMRANPEAALKVWWQVNPSAKRGATDAEAIANGLPEILAINKTIDVGSPPQTKYGTVNPELLQQYIDIFKEEGVVAVTPKPEDIYDNSFAECMSKFDTNKVMEEAKAWKMH